MKYLIILSAVLLLFSNTKTYSQDDPLDYYPLNNGNKWEYKLSSFSGTIYYESSYTSYTVVGNVYIAATGKHYKKIFEEEIYDKNITTIRRWGYIYQRIDTATYKVYELGWQQNNEYLKSLLSD